MKIYFKLKIIDGQDNIFRFSIYVISNDRSAMFGEFKYENVCGVK